MSLVLVEKEKPLRRVKRGTAEMGISRQKPEKQVQEATVKAEQRGSGEQETTK